MFFWLDRKSKFNTVMSCRIDFIDGLLPCCSFCEKLE
jgi:hypothetical protein